MTDFGDEAGAGMEQTMCRALESLVRAAAARHTQPRADAGVAPSYSMGCASATLAPQHIEPEGSEAGSLEPFDGVLSYDFADPGEAALLAELLAQEGIGCETWCSRDGAAHVIVRQRAIEDRFPDINALEAWKTENMAGRLCAASEAAGAADAARTALEDALDEVPADELVRASSRRARVDPAPAAEERRLRETSARLAQTRAAKAPALDRSAMTR